MMENRRKNFYTALVVRVMHTVLTVGVTVSAFALNTDLHRRLYDIDLNSKSFLYMLSYVLIIVLSLTFYFITCYIDPGYVSIPKRGMNTVDSDEDSDDLYDRGRVLTSGVKLRYCGFCGVEQPLRARHCETCCRCVRCFDHHCPWLGVCVGELNHRYFLLFLSLTLFASVWSAYIFFTSLIHTSDALSWLNANGLAALNLAVLVPASIVVAGLTFIHVYVALFNVTTWEFVSKSRISYLREIGDYPSSNPFHMGYCRNLAVFMCACGPQNWEKMHETNYTALPKEEQEEDPV